MRRRFSIINRAKGKLIAASRDIEKPDYEVRGVPTSPRCALHSIILYYTRSELASLALSLYVCLSDMDDIIIMHCTCTVLYQGP